MPTPFKLPPHLTTAAAVLTRRKFIVAIQDNASQEVWGTHIIDAISQAMIQTHTSISQVISAHDITP